MKRNYIVGLIVCSVPWVLLLVACGAKETAGMTAQPAATTEPALAEANPTKPPAMVVARSTATEPPLPTATPTPPPPTPTPLPLGDAERPIQLLFPPVSSSASANPVGFRVYS